MLYIEPSIVKKYSSIPLHQSKAQKKDALFELTLGQWARAAKMQGTTRTIFQALNCPYAGPQMRGLKSRRLGQATHALEVSQGEG